MSGKYKRLGKNTLVVFIGSIGSKLLSFIMLPFYTRWLSVEDYGVADLINSYAVLFLGIISCCISESVFIFPKKVNKEARTEYLTSAIYFCIAMIVLSGLFFGLLNKTAGTTLFTYSMAIWGIMSTSLLQSITQQFARSIDKMFVFGFTGIFQAIAVFCLSIILIPKWSVDGYIYSIMIANIITAIFAFLLYKGYDYFRFNAISKTKLIEMLKYSIPLVPNGIMFWVIGTLNRPLMESYCGLHTLGLYAIAVRVASIVSIVSSIFFSSWQISVLEEFGTKSYSAFYNKVIKTVSIGLIIVFFMTSVLSPTILKILTTPEFYGANQYIPLLMLGTILSAFSSFIAATFSAARVSKYYLYSSLLSTVVAITLNFILIPKLSIFGALIAYVFSFGVMAISRIIYSWRFVKLDKINNYILLSSICLVYAILYYKYGNSLILVVLGCMVCSVVSYKMIASIQGYIGQKK